MTRAEIFAVLTEIIQSTIPGTENKTITEQTSFRDLDADSLEIVEVVSRTMKALDVRVPRADLSSARNFGDLINLFEAAKNQTT